MDNYRSSRSSSISSNRSSTPVSGTGSASSRTTPDRQGIQSTIKQLADEQERVQKKTFTNWMNTYLSQHERPVKVEDLFEDIKSGVTLLSLLEVLTGEKLPMEKGSKMKRVHCVSNISTALQFLEKRKIKLVNINPFDIADGKHSIVLGLIWTIILYLQIERMTVQNQSSEATEETSQKKPPREGVKKAMLTWTANAITKPYGIEVNDFGKSWRDGVAFNAMIHNIRPDLVNLDQIRSQPARMNLEYAFGTAEDKLGIPRLIDAEDVDVAKPDEKSIMTYVAQFLQAYPEIGEDPAVRKQKRGTHTPEAELQEYKDLLKWMELAEETLQIVDQPLTDSESEYLTFMAFKVQFDASAKIYQSLRHRIKSKQAFQLTLANLNEMEVKWNSVQRRTHLWQLKLDRSLPGELCSLGEWLYKAEEFLEQRLDISDDANKMIQKTQTLIVQHEEIFKKLPAYYSFFTKVKSQGKYEGVSLPSAQMEHMNNRLQRVNTLVPQQMSMLTFYKSKYELVLFLDQIEDKCIIWSKKFVTIKNLDKLTTDYQSFVIDGDIQKEYETSFAAAKSSAEAYLKTEVGKKNVDGVKEFLENTEVTWTRLFKNIEDSGKTLEDSLEYWKEHDSIRQHLQMWLLSAEKVMQESSSEKQEFFQDLPEWEDRLKSYNEACFYLADVCEPMTIAQMNLEKERINHKFKDLVSKYKNFEDQMKGEVSQAYNDGVTEIAVWLTNVNSQLTKTVPCTQQDLKDYVSELDICNQELSEIEAKLKSTTRTSQTLVKNSPKETVDKVLETLRNYSESFKVNRKSITEKLKYAKIVLPNLESFEHGLNTVNSWMDDGEELLGKHHIDGDFNKVENWLEAHKEHFSQTPSQKSVLESKGKILQKIETHKPKLQNVDFTPPEQLLQITNERFQYVTEAATKCEEHLEQMLFLWQVYCQKFQLLDDWMDQAKSILNDSDDDTPSLLRKHEAFFDGSTEKKMYEEFKDAGRQLLEMVPDADGTRIKNTLSTVDANMKEIRAASPLRKIHLEFQLAETSFLQSVDDTKTILDQNKQKLVQNDNVKDALQKHKKYFSDAFYNSTENNLKTMDEIAQRFLEINKGDKSLKKRCDSHCKQWDKLCTLIDSCHLELKQLPERWNNYNARLNNFKKDVNKMNQLIIEMQKESLSAEEYQVLQKQFQEMLKNMSNYESDSTWLTQNLSTLLEDAGDTDGEKQKKELDAILKRFSDLKPAVAQTSSKSSVFSKCFQFRDDLDHKYLWLDETRKSIEEQMYVDGLEEAQTILQEHKVVIEKLGAEEANIKADLTKGQQLVAEGNTPSFVAQKTKELKAKYKETIKLAEKKFHRLKESANDWEFYENQKSQVMHDLKKAEAELDKAPVGCGQELAEKDLQEKMKLQQMIKSLKGRLDEMRKINAELCKGASSDRQDPLQKEITVIDNRLKNVSERLASKLTQLEGLIGRWSEYYDRLKNFESWLKHTEIDLSKLKDATTESPEKLLSNIELLCRDVRENHITLENLEEDSKELSQNFRSRETAALKSKLKTTRRQWQQLLSEADDCRTSYSGSVTHWQMYLSLLDQLSPWLTSAQQYCSKPVRKCDSIEDCKKLYSEHQEFLHDYEKQLLLFEKLFGEAHQVANQSEVISQVEELQTKLNSVQSGVEDITKNIEEIHSAFLTLDNTANKFQNVIQKYETKLSVVPKVNTVDLSILKYELATTQALTQEIQEQTTFLVKLNHQFEEVKPHASRKGVETLDRQQKDIKDSWNNVTELSDDRHGKVSAAVEHSEKFLVNLENFEKWLKSNNQSLTSLGEIYADDIPSILEKYQSMSSESSTWDDTFDKLSADFKSFLLSCSEDEAAVLQERFNRMVTIYTKVKDTSASRVKLCESWVAYVTLCKKSQGRLKQLELQLSSPDITESEIAEINRSIENVKEELNGWAGSVPELDSLMRSSQFVIKDRATLRNLHFATEFQGVESLLSSVEMSVSEKGDKIGELNHLWAAYIEKKDLLIKMLEEIKMRTDAFQVKESTPTGISQMIQNFEDTQSEISCYNPKYEEVLRLSHKIIQTDNSKRDEIQTFNNQVDRLWEHLHGFLQQKQKFCTASNMWQNYAVTRENVLRILQDEKQRISGNLCFNKIEDVREAIESCKTTELELHANQLHLDNFNGQGVALMEELQNIPRFNVSVIKTDMENVNQKWNQTNDIIINQRKKLEAQFYCWEQIIIGRDEMKNWLIPLIKSFEDHLQNLDDTISVRNKLQKYREELPVFIQLFDEAGQKISDLSELNGGHKIVSLQESHLEIQQQFKYAEELALQLEAKIGDFSSQYEALLSLLKKETEWIKDAKAQFLKCDDVSGTDDDILTRIAKLKTLKEEVAIHKTATKSLQNGVDTLKKNYQTAEAENLAQDVKIHVQKFESLCERAIKIETALTDCIQQQCDDGHQHLLDCITPFTDKLTWCAESSGDSLSAEAKLKALKDILPTVSEDEEKRKATISKMEKIAPVLSQEKQEELKNSRKKSTKLWNSTIQKMKETQKDLDKTVALWQEYDQEYGILSQWLKTAETKLRESSSLKPDLSAKAKHLEFLKKFLKDSLSQDGGFNSLKDKAEKLSKITGDSRTASYAAQVCERYATHIKTIKDQITKVEKCIQEHEDFVKCHKLCSDWLTENTKELKKYAGKKSKENLNETLQKVNVIADRKESGSQLLNAAIEAGEKLYPNTSTDGQNTIRQQVHDLQNRWQSFIDNLGEVQLEIENTCQQERLFVENSASVAKWLDDAKAISSEEPALMNTLQEKKIASQLAKTQYQDVLSHQTMIDNLSSKSKTLESPAVSESVLQISAEYSKVRQDSKKRVAQLEEYVQQHMLFQETYQRCVDWMQVVKDKFTIYSDLQGDKQTLQNKLDRLQELQGELNAVKEKVDAAVVEGENTIPQTGPKGQSKIKSDLQTVKKDLENMITETSESLGAVSQTVDSLKSLDNVQEKLSQWLKDAKSRFANLQLKSTLQEKQNQVLELKELEHEISSKKDEFDDLNSKIGSLKGKEKKLVAAGKQLMSKYKSLCKHIKDVIQVRNSYVQEHENYQNRYSNAKQFLENFKAQLKTCSDVSGNKTDNEEKLKKLKELIADKDRNSNSIQEVYEIADKLYPNTAVEGREIIRSEVRNLKDDWEKMADNMDDVHHKIEACLLQWQTFEKSFDNFDKWLADVNTQLRNMELQSLLPNKRAQLQNHRVLHQDILSRQHSLEFFQDRNQELIQSSTPADVQKPLFNLHNNYEAVLTLSKSQLQHLEQAVQDHQMYQEAHRDFIDWLNMAADKLEITSDIRGDRLSLQSKLERIKEYAGQIEKKKQELEKVTELCEKVRQKTSEEGVVVLDQEMKSVHDRWNSYMQQLHQAQDQMQNLMQQWIQLESHLTEFSQWVKKEEEAVKHFELKSSLDEKRTQLHKFKEKRDEILKNQSTLDSLDNEVQSMMQSVMDIHLSSQLSQLKTRYLNLVTLIKELIVRWEKYVEEHQLFEETKVDFSEWRLQMDERLLTQRETMTDFTFLEEKKLNLQMIVAEIEHGGQKLEVLIASGEKLFPDTAGKGRELIRQDTRAARESLDKLMALVAGAQQHVNTSLLHWSVFTDSQDELVGWIAHLEAQLGSALENQNTLQEKKNQVKTFKLMLEDIIAHQRKLDNVLEKANAIIKDTNNREVQKFITDVEKRFVSVTEKAKGQLVECEKCVSDHQCFNNHLQAANDWLRHAKEKMAISIDNHGDRQSLNNKLERIQEIENTFQEFESSSLDKCKTSFDVALQTTAARGQQAMKQELDMLFLDWDDLRSKLSTHKQNLEQGLACWRQYEDDFKKQQSWLKEMDKKGKDFKPALTKSAKEEQCEIYKELLTDTHEQERQIEELCHIDLCQEIKSKQPEMDSLMDEAHALQQLTGENRALTCTSQLTAHYTTLENTLKNLAKKCCQDLDDYNYYLGKLEECDKWLQKSKEKFDAIPGVGSSRVDLESSLESIQDILKERDTGLLKLNGMIEAGEKVISNSAPEGQDTTRKEMRDIKMRWETFFEDVTACQRKLEVALLQLVSFEDKSTQIEKWLSKIESQLESPLPLTPTLKEKKLQLQNYKVLSNDVQSYKYVIDSVGGNMSSFMETASQPNLAESISQMKTRYKKISDKLQKCQEEYTSIVTDHQEYNDEYNNCVEWLASIKEKLTLCDDVTGDKHAIQYRLDKIMDILATMEEGNPKVTNVVKLSEKVLPATAESGKEAIIRERDALKNDWSAFVSTVAEVQTDLENCKSQWEIFEAKYENCSLLVKQLENKIKGSELKKGFADKEEHLKMLKSQLKEMNKQRDSMEDLSEVAQNLSRMTSNPHISSKVAQLKSKHQVAISNITDYCRKWEGYVSDHQKHIDHYKDCQEWIRQMKEKIKSCEEPKGNKITIQDKLHEVQGLMAKRDDGQYKLQTAMDSLQMILPHTAVSGRQSLQKDLQTLQTDYDDLSTQMSSTSSVLEDCLSHWVIFDNEFGQLQQWLTDLENQVEAESKLQATPQEKKLSLERVMHVKLKLDSQKSTVNNFMSNTKRLHQMTKDDHLLAESKNIKKRYEKLVKSVQKVKEKCETQVTHAQTYRQSYIDAAEWLAFTRQLVSDNDEINGDKPLLEVQLNHIQEAVENIKEGEEKIKDTCSKGEIVMKESLENGQKLIRDELDTLKSDLEDLKSEVNQHQTKTNKLMKQWNEYENCYDQLCKWMADTEGTVKTHLQTKCHLADIDKQVAVTKKLLGEMNSKQKIIDELNQKAQQLQPVPSPKISSQVAQINATYSTLLNTTKDLTKRTEKLSADCKQFDKAYDSAKSWILSATKKVSECSSASGDKALIQKQLTKLHELVASKEEGQLLTHKAITVGEPLKVSVSPQSREVLQQKLDSCQQEWDLLVSSMSEAKVLLESNLLQWSDFTDSNNQVQKWMADMEKRLKEDKQAKVDLIEMKAYLQKMKNTYQDIVSHATIIESAVKQGQQLNMSSDEATVDVSQISNQYCSLKEKAQAQLTEAETQVGQYQNFHDSCEHFRTWLKSAKDNLTVCADINGDRSSIAIKSNRLKNQIEESKDGKQLFEQATASSHVILPNMAPIGKSKCQRELKNLKQDYDDYRNHLNAVDNRLQNCTCLWNQFEASVHTFDSFLKEIEGTLREDIQPKANLDEKKQLLTSFQEYCDKVSSHQSDLDILSKQAQELLQICDEAGVSYTITQLTTRFQTVINKIKDCVKNLEQSYYQHEVYNKCESEFTCWLDDVVNKLNLASDTSGVKDTIVQRLATISELQVSKDNGHLRLQKLTEAAEKVMPNTNNTGSQRLRQNCDTCKTNYDSFLSKMAQLKQKQENALANWEQFEEARDHMTCWLQECESRLNQCPPPKSDLAEKKSSLEGFKVIHHELASHKNNLKKLEAKSKRVNDESPKKSVSEIKKLYESLFCKSQEIVKHLEDNVKAHTEYRQTYLSCLEWLSNTKRRLQQIDNVSGDLHVIQERCSMLKEFNSSLPTGEQLVEKCSQLAECVCRNTGPLGCTIIEQELSALQDEWKALTMAVNESDANLQRSLSTWTNFENEYENFVVWFDDVERKSKELPDRRDNLSDKIKQLKEAEILLEEMKRQKETLEKIQDLGDKAATKSNDPRISHRLLKLTSQYHGLNTSLKNIILKLKENVTEHETFDSNYNTVMDWIDNCEKQLSTLNTTTDDLSVQEKLKTLNIIVNGMDETVYKVNKVKDSAEKIHADTSPNGFKSVEEKIAEMSSRWSRLNDSVTDCAFNLQNSQQKWQDYESLKESLETWLVEIRNLLSINPEIYHQLSEKKSQLDKYKLILSDINSKQRPITDLGRSLTQLDTLSPDNANAKDSYADTKSHYEAVKKQCQDIINVLEVGYQEHDEFQSMQHHLEQWLLEMSNKLTAQNVIDLSTLELTEQHVQDNQLMLENIMKHAKMFDDVEKKGENIIARNRGAPKLAENTRAQVKHLQEGYSNLLTSANKNKDNLAICLEHWHKYRMELEEGQKFLAEDLPSWKSEMSSHHPDNLQEAKEQLSKIKDMWEKLNSLRQNFNSSFAHCQPPAAAMVSDQANPAKSSALFALSEDVNHNLIGEMNQVENRLDALRDEIQSWEMIDKLKNDLRTTLRNKKEEIQTLEQTPARLPETAAEIEIAKLKTLKNDIDEKKSSLQDLSDRYMKLTQHNPQLSDTMIDAVREDWEELQSYIGNVLDEKEQGRKARKVFQDQQNEIDEDLARYAQELEKIELEGSSEIQRDRITPTREKRCGSTQTPDPSARQPGRRARLGSDTDNDSDTEPFASNSHPSSPYHHDRYHSWKKGNSMKESFRSGLFRSPSDLKLRNVVLESESEESGYGETNTMHASSFDMTLDNVRDFDGFQSTRTLYSSNSEDGFSLRSMQSEQGATGGWTKDASSQTYCNVRTQTPNNFWLGSASALSTDTLANDISGNEMQNHAGLNHNNSMQASKMSLYSTGVQTGNSLKGSKSNLLQNILLEVKSIKSDRGLYQDQSGCEDQNGSDLDTNLSSFSTGNGTILKEILKDVQMIRQSNAACDATTQTQSEQGTQTSFSSDSALHNRRHEKLRNMLDEVRNPSMDGQPTLESRPSSAASGNLFSKQSRSTSETSVFSYLPNAVGGNSSLTRQSVTPSLQTDFMSIKPGTLNASQNNLKSNYDNPTNESQQKLDQQYGRYPAANTFPGPSYGQQNNQITMSTLPDTFSRRKITQEDLNNASLRLERLRKYQLPESRFKKILPQQNQIPPSTFIQVQQPSQISTNSIKTKPAPFLSNLANINSQIPQYQNFPSQPLPQPQYTLTQSNGYSEAQRFPPTQYQAPPNPSHVFPPDYEQPNIVYPSSTTRISNVNGQFEPLSRRTRRSHFRFYDDMDLNRFEPQRLDYIPRSQDIRTQILDRYHLDEVLHSATRASRQLKKLTEKMKLSLKEEILKY